MKYLNDDLRRSLVAFAIGVIAILHSGCGSVHTFNEKHDTTFGKKAETVNVFQDGVLPSHLRRVAFLPIYKGRFDHVDMAGIEENFAAELSKRNLFEVVVVTEETMKDLFEKGRFSSIENLPTKIVSQLHSVYAIDGIMLVDVNHYNAYQPVGLGVAAKLFDGRTGRLVWSADHLFDASNPAVSNAARKYYKTESTIQYPLHETQTVLHSPTRFSKFVANSIFASINLKKR